MDLPDPPPDESGTTAQYSFDETLDWLRALRDQYQAIYHQA